MVSISIAHNVPSIAEGQELELQNFKIAQKMNRITKFQFSTSACLLAILCCVLCLTSCNKLEEGDVVEKWYEPTNTYVALMPLVISNGKTTTTMMIPYVITDYEDWCVKIKGKYKDEERIETIYVSQKQYECLSIGSHLKFTDDCSMSDENNHKVRQ
jgi:hypothetical protein